MAKDLDEFDEQQYYEKVVQTMIADLYSYGIYEDVSPEEVAKWFKNPTQYQDNIEKFVAYLYVSDSNVFQMFDTAFSIHSLNYKIENDLEIKEDDENLKTIKTALKKVKHKTLTRNIMTQTAAMGTLVGAWTGTKKKPNLYIFDDLTYVFPAYRNQGDWVVWIDLSWFDKMSEIQRNSVIKSLSPIISQSDYDAYKLDKQGYRYVEIPQKRSVCIRTHTLYRNQRFGIPWATQSFLDLLHKQRLEALEKSVANKVINSIAVAQLGSEKEDGAYHFSKLTPDSKRKVVAGIKSGLQANKDGGTPVIAVPKWADLKFVDPNTSGLDPDKFKTVNSDLNLGMNGVDSLVNGSSNFSSSKTVVDLLYRKVGVMLEQIEEEVYQKLFNWILKNELEDEYHIVYDKTAPLSTKEKVDVLSKLNASFGFSLKSVVDCLEGVDYETYLESTFYEQEVLKLGDRIKPYGNAFTTAGGESEVGNTTKTESDLSDAGAKSREVSA